jgi:uncharacterized protein (DUF58 family)
MKLHPWILKQFKKKSRIYIMPTKMGGYLNGLIFLMFLLSVGYSNNLLLIFTLFLFGLNLIWVIQTHFHLLALKVESVLIQDNFAREKTFVDLHWKKSPRGPYQWQLSLESKDESYAVESVTDSENHSVGQIIFSKRGVYKFPHLKVKTAMPFGLYQAWAYYPITAEAYVYPERLKHAPAVNFNASFDEGDIPSLKVGPHDIWNLGPYQGGESRKINWKHYARSGELVVKEGEELTKSEVLFKLLSLGENKEYILSEMATQMVLCARQETFFSLETPHKKRVSGLSACLRELTQC